MGSCGRLSGDDATKGTTHARREAQSEGFRSMAEAALTVGTSGPLARAERTRACKDRFALRPGRFARRATPLRALGGAASASLASRRVVPPYWLAPAAIGSIRVIRPLGRARSMFTGLPSGVSSVPTLPTVSATCTRT